MPTISEVKLDFKDASRCRLKRSTLSSRSEVTGICADFVMLGGMFAGHDQSGGELIEKDGRYYKMFYGMSSDTAMKKYHGAVAEYRASEGKTVQMPYRGDVMNTVQDILGGIRSACTYTGSKETE
ncbi:unnamed protein product, partial [Mesorhabditis spiculigera]